MKLTLTLLLGLFVVAAAGVCVVSPARSQALGAAVGSLSAPLLKLWQSTGGFVSARGPGDEANDLLTVQKALATDPVLNFIATPNGYFGEGTEAAIRAFQIEYGIPQTGVIDEPTLNQLNQLFLNQLCPSPIAAAPDLSLAHITKRIGLPSDYIPAGLVDITKRVRTIGVQCVTAATAQALGQLFAAAEHDGINLAVTSGYRRPDIQQLTHDFWLAVEGDKANTDSALPYHSEHQTGTAVDFAGSSEGFQGVDKDFGTSPEGQWLLQHAPAYGFNLSYPDEAAGEYVYEPWHWRFVGLELAAQLHAAGTAYNEIAASSPTAQTRTAPPDTVESVNELLTTNGHLF